LDTEERLSRTCKNLRVKKNFRCSNDLGLLNHHRLFEELLLAGSFEDLTAAALKFVHRLGFANFLYGAQNNRVTGPLTPFVLRGSVPAWCERYRARGYGRVDPLVAYSARQYVPVRWNELYYSSAGAAQIYFDGINFGVTSGWAFPLYGPRVKVAYVNLIARSNGIAESIDLAMNLGNAQMLACYVHEVVQKLEMLLDYEVVEGKQLSGREIECLRWSADGKTSWEIAQILRLSERTIIFHLGNAVQKLGAVNRRQAVVRAIALRLISP
jgi:DNA-binding CsgD family transcriptional regulator